MRWRAAISILALASSCAAETSAVPEDVRDRLEALVLPETRSVPGDATNAYADDPRAALFGQRLFFDPRFSGPLLGDDNTGLPGTLGVTGETGRVSCAGCHLPSSGFIDSRSPRRQISLASGWTRRRTPTLLDFGQASILMWDGRRDTAYNQLFGVIESPLEANSSRLFFAQQIGALYREEYEAVFGALPSLAYDAIAPADAGCAELASDPLTQRCPKAGQDDDAVIRIVVNAGKAIGAYERLLTCGPSRFDAFMRGDSSALSVQEQNGAVLFVRAGCDSCHSGPHFTDQEFHNVGIGNASYVFIPPFDDPGASEGLRAAIADPLSSRGVYSDGDDGRLDRLPADLDALLGAFRTPSLRCIGQRPSFMHAAQIRSLEDAVLFFDRGGHDDGFRGAKDARMVPIGWTQEERAAVVAFLRALDGPGPEASLLAAP
jgi:cytochrome c peroxidase